MKKIFFTAGIFCVLWGCSTQNYTSLVLTPKQTTVTQFNDTTFNSRGYIATIRDGFVITDDYNKFIATVDQNGNNLNVIGKFGQGPDEYPYAPRTFIQVENDLYIYIEKKLYKYDLQKKTRTNIDIRSFSKNIMNNFAYQRGNCLIFPLREHEYNFVSYNLLDGKIEYFHKNSVLKDLFQGYTYDALLDNDVFAVVEYDNQNQQGFLHTFSLRDQEMHKKTEIPLNDGLLNILAMAPEAPAFDGIYAWKNRIFIAYNTTGLVTTKVNSSGSIEDWVYLDYPEEGVNDRIVLFNFCVTDKNLVFVNQGALRFYENPF